MAHLAFVQATRSVRHLRPLVFLSAVLLTQLPCLAQAQTHLSPVLEIDPAKNTAMTLTAPVISTTDISTPDISAPDVIALNPVGQRYTAAAVQADLRQFAKVQTALLALNSQQTLSNDFVWVKAQRWLDVAQDEYRNNNRGAVPQQALGEALRLMPSMQAPATTASSSAGMSSSTGITPSPGVTPSLGVTSSPGVTLTQAWGTAMLESAPLIRGDLWTRIGGYQAMLFEPTHPSHAAANCSAGALAYTQVQLAWASWVNTRYGWRSALPYIAHAEKMLDKADAQFNTCAEPRARTTVQATAFAGVCEPSKKCP